MKFAVWLWAMLWVGTCRSDDSLPFKAQNADRIVTASQRGKGDLSSTHELGRRVYNFRCYYCHGYSGNARTVASHYLSPKPRDFTQTDPDKLSRDAMLHAVSVGKPNTAMKGFVGLLTKNEITHVVDFVRKEFMIAKAENTRYHSKENGWPQHVRYRAAYPFARGDIPVATPWEQLSAEQRAGKRLYMSSCITCHDHRTDSDTNQLAWDPRPLSFPRGAYTPGGAPDVDATTSASPYVIHDRAPQIQGLTSQEKLGEALYQANCAFCHAADGSGRNWIGSFLEPHPRDLTEPIFRQGMTKQRLVRVISDGLSNSSMPAWKNVLSPSEIQAVVVYVTRAFLTVDEPALHSRRR